MMKVRGEGRATLKGFSPTPGIHRNTNSPALKSFRSPSRVMRTVSGEWNFFSLTLKREYSICLFSDTRAEDFPSMLSPLSFFSPSSFRREKKRGHWGCLIWERTLPIPTVSAPASTKAAASSGLHTPPIPMIGTSSPTLSLISLMHSMALWWTQRPLMPPLPPRAF